MGLLSFAEISGLLDEVDESLSNQTPTGMAYTLYVVGGAVISQMDSQRLTADIDVADENIPQPVIDAVSRVAQKRGLSNSWINNQVSEMLDADLPLSAFQELYRGKHLLLLGAKPDTMLALKLMSGRGRDIKDIIILAEAVNVSETATMLAICDRVFKHTASWGTERGFVENTCADIAPLVRRHIAGQNIDQDMSNLSDIYDGIVLEPDAQANLWIQESVLSVNEKVANSVSRKPCKHIGKRSRTGCVLRSGHSGHHRYGRHAKGI